VITEWLISLQLQAKATNLTNPVREARGVVCAVRQAGFCVLRIPDRQPGGKITADVFGIEAPYF
jgi:hypothetical protein